MIFVLWIVGILGGIALLVFTVAIARASWRARREDVRLAMDRVRPLRRR